MTKKPMRFCDVGVWPLFDGKNITVTFTEGVGDDAVDILSLTLTHDEIRALAGVLRVAAECETDVPSFTLNSIRIND